MLQQYQKDPEITEYLGISQKILEASRNVGSSRQVKKNLGNKDFFWNPATLSQITGFRFFELDPMTIPLGSCKHVQRRASNPSLGHPRPPIFCFLVLLAIVLSPFREKGTPKLSVCLRSGSCRIPRISNRIPLGGPRNIQDLLSRRNVRQDTQLLT